MAKEIEIVIEPDGSCTIEALGFEGKSCTDYTKELEKVLGQTVSERKKAEYYKPQKGQVKH